jgi:hypothetical protein
MKKYIDNLYKNLYQDIDNSIALTFSEKFQKTKNIYYYKNRLTKEVYPNKEILFFDKIPFIEIYYPNYTIIEPNNIIDNKKIEVKMSYKKL